VGITAYLLHHSESIDPTLLDWIRHEIDALVGLGPVTIVLILGVLILAFPIALMLAARRQIAAAPRRSHRSRLARLNDARMIDKGGES
jgi:hypothetical protein